MTALRLWIELKRCDILCTWLHVYFCLHGPDFCAYHQHWRLLYSVVAVRTLFPFQSVKFDLSEACDHAEPFVVSYQLFVYHVWLCSGFVVALIVACKTISVQSMLWCSHGSDSLSVQELNIEKQLEKIESTWSQLYLSFSQYQDTDVSQMNADDAITEALEADNLTLQNMSGGKYVQGNEKFKQMVNDWQTKLGTVESVLTCWGDVQKKWQALESIFIGSADIRVQLPEDSKRFDAINADFQDLMRSAPDVTGVVEACNLDGRDERLNNLLSQLEMCEKALQACHCSYSRMSRIALRV